MINLFRFISLRQLKTKPLRTLLTTLGVALGLSLWVAIQNINRSTLKSFKDSIESMAGKASLTISAGEAGFRESILEKIKVVSGVKAAIPMVLTRGHFVDKKVSTTSLMVLGVDLLKESAVRTYKVTENNPEQMIDDPLIFLNQPDSIILTHAFADEHHLKIDDGFELATAFGKKKFTVRGLLTPEGAAKAYGGAIALMDIDGAQYTFGKQNKYDRIDIVLNENEEVEKVKEKLQLIVGETFNVQRPQNQSEEMERLVKSFQVMLEFFSLLALFVGLFMVTNSISISVAERRREIGTLRALGANRIRILSMFIFEAAVIGLIGSALGALIGYGFANVLVKDVTDSMAGQFVMYIQTPEIVFGWYDVSVAIFIGTFFSMLSAFYPSYSATKIGPLEAIKYTEASANSKLNSLPKIIPILGCLFLGSSIFFTLTSSKWNFILLQKMNLLFTLAGAALITPQIVFGILTLITKFLDSKSNQTGIITRLSTLNLIRNRKRTASNIAILMIGLCFVIIIACVNLSFRSSIMTWLDRALTADLLVSSSGNLVSLDVQPLDESVGYDLAKVEGVDTIPGRPVFSQRYIRIKYEGEQIAIKAMEEPDPRKNYSQIISLDRKPYDIGRDLYHNAENTVAVSMSFADHFHKKSGDFIELKTPTGLMKFKVVGIVIDYANPKGVLYMNRSFYKKYWNDKNINVFGIWLKPGYNTEQVRKNIEIAYGKTINLSIISNAEIKKQMVDKINQSFTFLKTVEICALIVALLGILNTLLVSVMERTREIGLLRAVGMEQKQVFSLIMKEAFFQGLLGSLIAITLGSWIAYSWLSKSLSVVLGWIIDFYYPWNAIASTLLFGIIVSLLAGLIPSNRAAKIDIKEALEYE